MAGLNTVAVWRFKKKIVLGDPNGWETLPNGNTVSKFVPKYTLHCAPYRVSNRNIDSMIGTDIQNTIVVAVRHHSNFDYEAYQAQYRGKLYEITYVVPDYSTLVTYDLLSLKLVVKNGAASQFDSGGDDSSGTEGS